MFRGLLVESAEFEGSRVGRRVTFIENLMISGKWRIGRSDKELADKWACDASCVRRYSAEASRSLRRLVAEDREALRMQLGSNLSQILNLALRGEQQDLRAAIQAIDGQARLFGLHETAKYFSEQ